MVQASTLIEAGYELWPTEIIVNGEPDPRNDVHFDLVLAKGTDLVPEILTTGTKSERSAARELLAPRYEQALSLFGMPLDVEE